MTMEIVVDPIKRERLNMKNDCSVLGVQYLSSETRQQKRSVNVLHYENRRTEQMESSKDRRMDVWQPLEVNFIRSIMRDRDDCVLVL